MSRDSNVTAIHVLGVTIMIAAMLLMVVLFAIVLFKRDISKEKYEHLICVQNIYGEDFILDVHGSNAYLYKCEGIDSHKYCNK